MFGLIGKMVATPGKRGEVIAILLQGVTDMPGCLAYIVGEDATDENAIWITEAWDSESSHKASLTLPSVRQAITKARPLIAGFGERIVMTPVGGHGLAPSKSR
jgi:quinol monooxygenase YgiN